MNRRFLLTASTAILALTSLALACRYTVRDIGFVELGLPGPRLVVFDKDRIPAIKASLADIDIEILSVDPAVDPSHAAVFAAEALGADFLLMDAQGRTLAIDDPLVIGHGPWARRLSGDADSSFAHVLLLESGDERLDSAAERTCLSLETSLKALEEHLPRPLGHPLRIERIDTTAQEREPSLFWSLGVDVPVREPTVLVLYGKAKRAGEPVRLVAENAVDGHRELLAQLALVGESCECDTTRAWAEEPAGLVPWTREDHARAARSLGFDPESPIVRNEIVRILARTPAERGEEQRPESLEQLLLGYEETTLSAPDPPPGEALSTATGSPPPPAVLQGAPDDDWDFEDPDEPEVAPTGTNMPAVPGSATWMALGIIGMFAIITTCVGIFLLRSGRR